MSITITVPTRHAPVGSLQNMHKLSPRFSKINGNLCQLLIEIVETYIMTPKLLLRSCQNLHYSGNYADWNMPN